MRFSSLLFLLLLTVSCASPPPVADVPFLPQQEGHCGEIALAMLLNALGESIPPKDMRSRLYLPAYKGTVSPLMVIEANARGFRAEIFHTPPSTPSIHPPPFIALLGSNETEPRGHFVVVTAWRPGEWVRYHSQTPHQKVSWAEFMDKWAKSGYEGILITR